MSPPVRPLALPDRGGALRLPRGTSLLRRWLVIAAIIALFLVCGMLLAAALGAQLGFRVAGVALVAAAVPLGVVVPSFLWLDRYEAEPRRYLGFAFGWGALVAATLSLVLNTGSLVVLRQVHSDGEALAMVAVAPVVEESFKALGVVLIWLYRRQEFDGIVDGIVYAGLVATGFAFAENVLYLGQALVEGGPEALVSVFVVRCVLGPFAHPLFTCATGAAIGLVARRASVRQRIVIPLVGLALGIVLHAGWNVSALIGLNGYLNRYLLLQLPLFLVGVVGATVERRREGRLIARNLTEYVHLGWLTSPEVDMLADLSARRSARHWARATGGRSSVTAMRTFQDTATDLAFLRERVRHGTARPDAREVERAQLELLTDARTAFLASVGGLGEPRGHHSAS